MSPSDWIALGVVAACGAWALWRFWRWLRGRSGCGCDHCPATRRKDGPSGG